MNITIIGAGNMGSALAQVLSRAGHSIRITARNISARYLGPLAGLNIYFGYGAGLGTSIAPAWIHKAA